MSKSMMKLESLLDVQECSLTFECPGDRTALPINDWLPQESHMNTWSTTQGRCTLLFHDAPGRSFTLDAPDTFNRTFVGQVKDKCLQAIKRTEVFRVAITWDGKQVKKGKSGVFPVDPGDTQDIPPEGK